jgi:hypothetical protein
MKVTKEHIQELIAELDAQVYKDPIVLCSPRFRDQIDEALKDYCTAIIKPTFKNYKQCFHGDYMNDTLKMEWYDFNEHRIIYGQTVAINIRLERYQMKKKFLEEVFEVIKLNNN